MRVLRVIPSTCITNGGAVEVMRHLQAPLSGLGVDTEVATCDAPDSPWLAANGLPISALGPALGKYAYAPRLAPWLKANVSRFDAVIVDGIWQYHSLATWRVLRRTGTPYFVFTHGMLDPWFKRQYPLKHVKKMAYWPWAERRVLRDARAVIFTSDEERVLARQSFWPYRVTEAVCGLGTSKPPVEEPRAFLTSHPHLSGKRIVLFLGRLHPKKGCDMLVEAFAGVARTDDRLHLLIAGPDGAGLASQLKSRARQLGIDEAVSWLGLLQGAAKWDAVRAADVLCLPSHQENFGLVVAEALACGRPVLISNRVNIWRAIHDDGAGFVDEDTVEGTSRNLRRWLALSPAEYGRMCERAETCFTVRFEITGVATQLVEILRNGTGTGQARRRTSDWRP